MCLPTKRQDNICRMARYEAFRALTDPATDLYELYFLFHFYLCNFQEQKFNRTYKHTKQDEVGGERAPHVWTARQNNEDSEGQDPENHKYQCEIPTLNNCTISTQVICFSSTLENLVTSRVHQASLHMRLSFRLCVVYSVNHCCCYCCCFWHNWGSSAPSYCIIWRTLPHTPSQHNKHGLALSKTRRKYTQIKTLNAYNG